MAKKTKQPRSLDEIKGDIREVQEQIANGTYRQGELTQTVNRLNELKQEQQDILDGITPTLDE